MPTARTSPAPAPARGKRKVARFILGIVAKLEPGQSVRPIAVNGALGIAVDDRGPMDTVISFTVVRGLLATIDFVRAPAKLAPSS